MNLTKKQAEFWVAILVLCLVVAIAITLVDFSIKSAILRESNALRLKIEAWEVANGRGSKETVSNGAAPNATDDTAISGTVLVDSSPGMETTNVPDGAEDEAATESSNGTQPRRPSRSRGVSQRNK